MCLLQRSVPLRRNPRLRRGQGKDDLRASQDQQVSTHRRLKGVEEKTHLKDCVQETALGSLVPQGPLDSCFPTLGHPGTRMSMWAWLPPWWPETGASFTRYWLCRQEGGNRRGVMEASTRTTKEDPGGQEISVRVRTLSGRRAIREAQL